MKTKIISLLYFLTGALFLVLGDKGYFISDINKFGQHFEYSSIVIMSTYVIAQ